MNDNSDDRILARIGPYNESNAVSSIWGIVRKASIVKRPKTREEIQELDFKRVTNIVDFIYENYGKNEIQLKNIPLTSNLLDGITLGGTWKTTPESGRTFTVSRVYFPLSFTQLPIPDDIHSFVRFER